MHHVPIVSFQWITDCQVAQKLIDYEPFRFKLSLSSEDLQKLFAPYHFYFPHVSQFNNFNINKSRITFDQLRILITKCGGYILNELSRCHKTTKMVYVKCNSSFDRALVDPQVEEWMDKGQADEAAVNDDFDEVIVDFHWITDSIYKQKLLPLNFYEINDY